MNKKINILRAILIILLLIMFGTIFNFSNQNGDKSGSLSREVTEKVTQNINSIQKLEKSEKEKVLNKIDLKNIKRAGISLGISALYAATDEFHQLFIPDRTSSVFDVLIDSSGALTGIILTFLVIRLAKKILKKS